ncbi:MAG TPA: carbonic anhydrase [Malonomonas sp.]
MRKFLVLAICLSFGLAGTALASESGSAGVVHWGYSGAGGPAHWGVLQPEFKMCGEGQQQSPINIVDTVEADLPELTFNYVATNLELVNNGHTIKANYAPGSSIRVGGDEYKLLQFHFHSLSENAVDGKLFPVEAHLVHANSAGELAVVGVLFDEGAANPLLEKLWRYTPSRANSTMAVASTISVTELLPASADYYGFSGSLTTPPCTEGVRWMALKQPVTASAEQISKFRSFFGDHDTNRPVQPLNGRIVYQ